jgi:predicted RNase H-related nuclease YkuK (DUF458 family)
MVKNTLTGTKSDSEMRLNSLTHGVIGVEESIRLIRNFLEEKPSAQYSIVIGTDSHEKENNGDSKTINLVTAVLVHRRGFGGKYFWRRKDMANIHSLREKIYAETLESLKFSFFFLEIRET